MNHPQRHWLEKLVLQLTTAAAMVVAYYLVYPSVRLHDSQLAIAFLPTDSFRQVGVFAISAIVLAVACGLMTLSTRAEGAIVAALLAAGGVSLRSPAFETLLWRQGDDFGHLFVALIGEVLFLAAVVAAMVLVATMIRRTVERVRPTWLWQSPVPRVPSQAASRPNRPEDRRSAVGKVVVSTGLAVVAGVVLLLVLMQSARRGQVLFSLLVSFMLAVMFAQRIMPSPFRLAFLAAPLIAAVFLYALASVASVGQDVQDWINVPIYARVLPIDWFSAGCGGAMLGCWFSERANEARYFEGMENTKKGD